MIISRAAAAEIASTMQAWAADPELYEGDCFSGEQANTLRARVEADGCNLDPKAFSPQQRNTIAQVARVSARIRRFTLPGNTFLPVELERIADAMDGAS